MKSEFGRGRAYAEGEGTANVGKGGTDQIGGDAAEACERWIRRLNRLGRLLNTHHRSSVFSLSGKQSTCLYSHAHSFPREVSDGACYSLLCLDVWEDESASMLCRS